MSTPQTAEELLAVLRASHVGPSVLDEVAAERERQEELWGEQNHPDGTGPDLRVVLDDAGYLRHHGITAGELESWAKRRYESAEVSGGVTFEMILTEEWAEAIASDDPLKLRAELIQVAAVAAGWVQKIDRDLAKKALLCPECENGKSVNCVGQALDPETDDFLPCATTKASS